MATVLRGKHKGKAVVIYQFANDWVSDVDGKIYKVTQLSYSDDEIKAMRAVKNTGTLLSEHRIVSDPVVDGRYIFRRSKGD